MAPMLPNTKRQRVIFQTIKKHEPYLELAYGDLYNHQTLELDDDDDNDDDNHEFSMLNPNLIDYDDEDPPGQAHIGSVAPAIINNITLPNNIITKCAHNSIVNSVTCLISY